MEIIFEKRFLKDIRKIKEKKVKEDIKKTIEEIELIIANQKDTFSIPNIRKMIKLKSYDHFFRIRIKTIG